MSKYIKPLTVKQRYAKIRKHHLINFRRYLALKGDGEMISDWTVMNAFELREYIEGQWLTDMSWENYGEYWVVDHIVPLRYFDPTSHKEMKLCWNYNNLKPSYYWDNHAKGYCLEVTTRILDGRPKSPVIELLKEKIKQQEKMFQPYYK